MFKLVLEKAEEPEIKLPTSAGSWKKQESSRKNIYFCLIDYAKVFDCVDHNKLWKILREMGITDHLTSLLRNLYADQEIMVRTGQRTTDWLQIGKEYIKAVYFTVLFKLICRVHHEKCCAGGSTGWNQDLWQKVKRS